MPGLRPNPEFVSRCSFSASPAAEALHSKFTPGESSLSSGDAGHQAISNGGSSGSSSSPRCTAAGSAGFLDCGVRPALQCRSDAEHRTTRFKAQEARAIPAMTARRQCSMLPILGDLNRPEKWCCLAAPERQDEGKRAKEKLEEKDIQVEKDKSDGSTQSYDGGGW
eukprot:TRINITY_DN9572_c0_g1_i1.p2 TRINITY_DN9572_c0_g1~~TRINITY_DN9572_c0_g1_i1.p2  ORF type:complete len:166 (-),score=36.49 TRINITY_DN9572_c0_g1_i1:506-1003(-)